MSNDQAVPANNAASIAFALSVLGANTRADAFTPLTVKVHSADGEATHYAVASISYDARRDEYVLELDEDSPAPGKCEFTMSHTRHWCGNPRCRES